MSVSPKLLLLAIAAVVAAASVPGSLRQATSGWPACDPGVKQFSGYFDINNTMNKHYFYWAFTPRNNISEKGAPIILWLTGGPGCSGTLALFAENGPCHIHESNGSLYRNPYSWNEAAIVVYVDQPAGVGYSYSDAGGYDSDEQQVAHDMYYFVQHLLKAHPDWAANDFFVFGESYGGHFSPATAHRIWLGNKNKEGEHVNLKGFATGNGLVSPVVQYNYYGELAYTYCNEVLGSPCISQLDYYFMNLSLPTCMTACHQCDQGDTLACDLGRIECNGQLTPYMETGLNPYDIRIPCGSHQLCYNFDAVTAFLNQPNVQQALGVANENITWSPCDMGVNGDFAADWLHRFDLLVPDLLNSGIRMLVYAGDMDFICNWLGNKAWTLALPWSGRAAFQNATDVPWTIGGKTKAWARSVPGTDTPILFTFLRVHDAGHMVPMNQPETALLMIEKFLANKPFH